MSPPTKQTLLCPSDASHVPLHSPIKQTLLAPDIPRPPAADSCSSNQFVRFPSNLFASADRARLQGGRDCCQKCCSGLGFDSGMPLFITALICFLQAFVNFDSHPWILFALLIILEIFIQLQWWGKIDVLVSIRGLWWLGENQEVLSVCQEREVFQLKVHSKWWN